LRSSRNIMFGGFGLLLVHALVLGVFGTSGPGPFLSDLTQLTLGILVLVACSQASGRSGNLGRHFWQLAEIAFCLWLVAQALSTYQDLFATSIVVMWTVNLLFSFWFVPLAMALFLDPDYEPKKFDTLLILDFVQAILFCLAAYLYFFYIPSQSEGGAELAHSVWEPYFIGYGLLAGGFLLRSFFSSSDVVRGLLGKIGFFLVACELMDAAYYYGPGSHMKTGAWFDICWSFLLLLPLVTAVTWDKAEFPKPETETAARVGSLVVAQLFPLLYPLLILIMFAQIAQERITLAVVVVLISFVCSSARLLVTHHRLLEAKEALRREASHDGLTGLWNRTAILRILETELLRAVRDGTSVGVIMADVDHFKTVNDTGGHAAGDIALRIVASEVAAVVRPYDSVGRYGGEEFLIVTPGCGMEKTWELAERIRNSVASSTISLASNRLAITLSLGIVASGEVCDPEALLSAADAALYQAKEAGRNQVQPRPEGISVTAELAKADRNFWL
jgi:diguanylate cyclase (GGDEF)-like protein